MTLVLGRMLFLSIGLVLLLGCGATTDAGDDVRDTVGSASGAEVCGGIQGLPCERGEFCNLDVGNCCCNFQGVCAEPPQFCITLFKPVCGCDGESYGNSCEAAMASVSVASEGSCN